MATRQLFGGRDPRDLPAYTVADAARYLRVPAATLRAWFAGRSYPRKSGAGTFAPVIAPADPAGVRLSFLNLVEAHVLRALRTEHGIALSAVRTALGYAETKLGIERVLLSESLLTGAGEVFIEHYGELVSLSRSGQLALRRVLELYLRRVERDDRHIPLRLFPFLTPGDRETQSVAIDPAVSGGRPVLAGSGITTAAIVRRIDQGESPDHVARDYGLTVDRISDAILFERAA